MHESENEREVAQSCPTLNDPMDCSLPGSSIHGIFQARVLEWGAIAFSGVTLQLTLKQHVFKLHGSPYMRIFSNKYIEKIFWRFVTV